MWWQPNGWGFGIELTHAKACAPHNEMTAAGFDDLEFTDGHNLITLNAAKRWENKWKSYTPYVGVGLGIAMPHVDVTPTGGESTYGYQMTGPVLRLTAGVTRALTDRISLFGEYQFSVSQNEAELDGGGDLSTRLITNALNVGISYSF
jgi:lipid A oxidase